MEFEDTNNQSASDEARRLAESRKLTLNPVHADVAPDPRPDSEDVARHVNGPAIANVPNDTEETAGAIRPSQGVLNAPSVETQRRGNAAIVTVVVSLAVVVAAVGSFFLFVR